MFPEDIADYYKGEAHIIIEEFTLSLIELPHIVYTFFFSGLAFVLRKLDEITDRFVTTVENMSFL